MPTYHGQLFKISILRIPTNQEFDDPLSAVNGYVEGEPFCVGIIHTDNETGALYVATSGGKILAEGDDLEAVGGRVLELAKAALSLNKEEVEELQNIMLIQDDAEYDLDEDKWKFTLGSGGEVSSLADEFRGALIVNVTPYYDADIETVGRWAEAGDESCAEDHEFCGALRA